MVGFYFLTNLMARKICLLTLVLLCGIFYFAFDQKKSYAAARDLLEGGKEFELQRYNSAFKILEPLAGQENYFAKGLVAIMYGRGLAMAQNTEKSNRLIKPNISQIINHANKGDVLAQYLLGKLYLNGVGVPLNPQQGLTWLTKSAKLGNKLAQFRLGEMYEKGNLVKKNKEQAVKWYKLAAINGFSEGNQRIKAMQAPKSTVESPLKAKKVGKLNKIIIAPLPLEKTGDDKESLSSAKIPDKVSPPSQNIDVAKPDSDENLLGDSASSDLAFGNLQMMQQYNEDNQMPPESNYKIGDYNKKSDTEAALCYQIAIDTLNNPNKNLPTGMRDYSMRAYSQLKSKNISGYSVETASRILAALRSSTPNDDDYYVNAYPLMKSFCNYAGLP